MSTQSAFEVSDPFERFLQVYERAAHNAPADHTAMALATADGSGRPSVRIVLLRGIDHRGFVFYTNFESRKARELEVNPRAALCFYWPWLDEQVRVEGRVSRVSDEESDAYFRSRPLGSRIGAWASRQSEPLESREVLEARCREIESRFPSDDVPRPPFWGGYRLDPAVIEFWRAGEHRLHDRFVYRRTPSGWTVDRLYP